MSVIQNDAFSGFNEQEKSRIKLAIRLIREFEPDFTEEQKEILSDLSCEDLIIYMAMQINEQQIKTGVYNFKLPVFYKDKFGNYHRQITLALTL